MVVIIKLDSTKILTQFSKENAITLIRLARQQRWNYLSFRFLTQVVRDFEILKLGSLRVFHLF